MELLYSCTRSASPIIQYIFRQKNIYSHTDPTITIIIIIIIIIASHPSITELQLDWSGLRKV